MILPFVRYPAIGLESIGLSIAGQNKNTKKCIKTIFTVHNNIFLNIPCKWFMFNCCYNEKIIKIKLSFNDQLPL